MVSAHKTNISELDGLGRKMPITMLAFTIGSLGIIGLPPASGLWSKLLIAQGTLQNGQIWLIAVLMLSTLLNIAYLLQVPLRAFFREPKDDEGHDHDHSHADDSNDYDISSSNSMTAAGWQEAPAPALWAIVMTSSVVILLFFYPSPLLDLLEMIQWR